MAALHGCDEKKPAQTEAEPHPDIITKEILSTYQNCSPDSMSCTYAMIDYQVFTDSGKSVLNNAIKEKIMLIASDFMREGGQQTELSDIADAFVDDYEQFVAEYADYDLGWSLTINSEIIYHTATIISYRVDVASFTGGAHPNSSSDYFVMDAGTARELKMGDIISDTTQFKQILEAAFRKTKGMDTAQSFAEAGYYINDGDFILNDNIGLTDEYVIAHFNPYEIAPYSLGPTTIELDREQVRPIMKIE
jgi:hypothetical protein